MVALFPQSVNLWLKANQVVEEVYGADGQFEDAVVIGYGAGIPDLGPDTEKASAVIEASMVPLPYDDTLKELLYQHIS